MGSAGRNCDSEESVMRVQVRLAEPFWRSVGKRDLQVELDKHATLGNLLSLLHQQYPALSTEMEAETYHIFINDTENGLDALLQEGDRVHIVWPIAGG